MEFIDLNVGFLDRFFKPEPDSYRCVDIEDFLKNRDSITISPRQRWSSGARFNGMAFVSFQCSLYFEFGEIFNTLSGLDGLGLPIKIDDLPLEVDGEYVTLTSPKLEELRSGKRNLLHRPVILYLPKNRSSYLVNYQEQASFRSDFDSLPPPNMPGLAF